MASCDKCKKEAVEHIRYSGAHLCLEHIDEFVLKRVKKELRNTLDVPRASDFKIAVAVSGGKDSLALLDLLSRTYGKWRNVKLVGITVDEGVDGYRPPSLGLAEGAYKAMDIEYRIGSFKEHFGKSLDNMVLAMDAKMLEKDSNGGVEPCSYCGVLRRRVLNDLAKEVGADVLATGHNLDDHAQSVLMNLMKGDIKKLFRLAPHAVSQPGLIPRTTPLRWIPQREIVLYVLNRKIPMHEDECPYAARAHRRVHQDILAQYEEKVPGTRHSLLRVHEQIIKLPKAPSHREDAILKACTSCGQPSSGTRCQVCVLLEDIR